MAESISYPAVKKVHVIFLTHLDIGFTDLSSAVLQKYVDTYIPDAINLAERMNQNGRKQFIWTVGSFLVDYYLNHVNRQKRERMERAIEEGNISWHGIATTVHSELMDQRLLDFSLDISRNLDKQFHKKTIGAKMTDVPGHTIAIVPALAAHGIRYLHIGANCGSTVPRVPELFVWKNGNSDVIVHYSDDYGKTLVINGFDEAVEYACTGDNAGPQSKEAVRSIMDGLQKKYPCAEVYASTISAFAESISHIEQSLPVITEEIGDTWIHGCGTDPYKISCYNDLLRCKEQWLADGRLKETSKIYHDFMMSLLLITEHTGSVDIKKYLFDFTNWNKWDFREARRRNKTTLELIPSGYESLKKIIVNELNAYRGGAETGSYNLYEKAQEEQTNYLNDALNVLPSDLRAEGEAILKKRKPQKAEMSGQRIIPGQYFTVGKYRVKIGTGQRIIPGQYFTVGKYRVKIGTGGQLDYLQVHDRIIVEDGGCADLSYEIFDVITVKNSQYLYNVRLKNNLDWTEADYAKPGLEAVPDLRHKIYQFSAVDIRILENRITVALTGDQEATEVYGCPRYAELIYCFEDTLKITLNWFDKDANRIPEAIWLGFRFKVENPYLWKMRKIDSVVSPYDVVSGGNRKQHCCRELLYHGADGGIKVYSLHIALVSVGARNLYTLDDRVDDVKNGFFYNLFNNRWGTNYKTWCEDDVSVCFEIGFE